jgi:hypothetical protein
LGHHPGGPPGPTPRLAGGHVFQQWSAAVDAQRHSNGRPTLLKALFILVTTLLLVAIVYAGWIVISYWDRVAV